MSLDKGITVVAGIEGIVLIMREALPNVLKAMICSATMEVCSMVGVIYIFSSSYCFCVNSSLNLTILNTFFTFGN